MDREAWKAENVRIHAEARKALAASLRAGEHADPTEVYTAALVEAAEGKSLFEWMAHYRAADDLATAARKAMDLGQDVTLDEVHRYERTRAALWRDIGETGWRYQPQGTDPDDYFNPESVKRADDRFNGMGE